MQSELRHQILGFDWQQIDGGPHGNPGLASVMLPILPELVMSPRCPSIHLALPSWFLPQETLTMVLAYRELEKDFGALLAFKECLDSKGAATASGKDLAF